MQQVSTKALHPGKTLTEDQIRVAAQKAAIPGHVKHHTFRHSFATHVLGHRYDIRTEQEFLIQKEAVCASRFTQTA